MLVQHTAVIVKPICHQPLWVKKNVYLLLLLLYYQSMSKYVTKQSHAMISLILVQKKPLKCIENAV